MAYSLNKVQLIGNLGADPEVRFSQAGRAIANLRIATSESWRDQNGEPQERTEWHRVVVFGKPAEIAQQYVRKGSKVYIEGQLQTREWQDQTGQKRYTTEVIVSGFSSQLIILDARSSTAPGAAAVMSGDSAGGGYTGQRSAPPPPLAATPSSHDHAEGPAIDDFRQTPDFHDDIPF